MIHPRLSVDAMSSYNWSFEREFALWNDMGVRHAGLLMNKIEGEGQHTLAAMDEAGIHISTLITGGFNLADPATWDATRALHRRMIDTVADHAGHSIYFTTGRSVRCDWNEDLALFAEAVAPTVAYGKERGVIAAMEPTLRTASTFCTTLRDAVDVAERTGLGIVSDFCNNWMERDLPATLRRAMPHIALVQIGDTDRAGRGDRVHIGKGSLPLERMMNDVLSAGYTGLFDLEVVPLDYTADTDEAELREGIEAASRFLYDMGV